MGIDTPKSDHKPLKTYDMERFQIKVQPVRFYDSKNNPVNTVEEKCFVSGCEAFEAQAFSVYVIDHTYKEGRSKAIFNQTDKGPLPSLWLADFSTEEAATAFAETLRAYDRVEDWDEVKTHLETTADDFDSYIIPLVCHAQQKAGHVEGRGGIYSVSFVAVETTNYRAQVEARSPEEALEKFALCPSQYKWEERGYETSGVEDIEVEGEWVKSPIDPSALRLIYFS